MVQPADIHIHELGLGLVLEESCTILSFALLDPMAVDSEGTGVNDLRKERDKDVTSLAIRVKKFSHLSQHLNTIWVFHRFFKVEWFRCEAQSLYSYHRSNAKNCELELLPSVELTLAAKLSFQIWFLIKKSSERKWERRNSRISLLNSFSVDSLCSKSRWIAHWEALTKWINVVACLSLLADEVFHANEVWKLQLHLQLSPSELSV